MLWQKAEKMAKFRVMDNVPEAVPIFYILKNT